MRRGRRCLASAQRPFFVLVGAWLQGELFRDGREGDRLERAVREANSPPAAEPLVVVEHLTKRFRQGGREIAALSDVSFEVYPGEIFGVMGLSGAGKSTLIRCINLLERPDEGRVVVAGQEMTRLSGPALMQARRRIGMIFQHFALLSSRTVAGNVAFPLEIAGVSRPVIAARVAELLDLVGLGDRAQAYPSQLSGGQKQRVGIARALASEPVLLLSDEATSALDPETTVSVLQLLKEINQKMGLTILMITHEMQVIRQICHRVAVIDQGRLVEVGPVAQVFSRPSSEVARRLLREQLQEDVPPYILERARKPGQRLLRLGFLGQVAQEPVVAELMRQFPVVVNVLFGRIEELGGVPWGRLVVEISGDPGQVVAACEYLRRRGVEVEEIEGASPPGETPGQGGEEPLREPVASPPGKGGVA
ncbi:MAG: methionine ABC transporter ATP-binding protein [Limnochordales bacterium]|nr:methionine ABC transporter ATP-binding protein [Limnochordales bacterium]